MTTRVLRYGLLRPTTEMSAVLSQMRLAHKYYNDRTELEHHRRHALRAAMAEIGDTGALESEVEVCAESLTACRDAVRKCRADSRARTDTARQRAAVKDAKMRLAIAKDALSTLRQKVKDDTKYKARIARIEELCHQMQISGRKHCGVYWGTYQLVEAATDQARKDTPLYQDPAFRAWRGDGAIGVQFQGGVEYDELRNDTQMQLDADERAWYGDSRGERRLHSRSVLRFRVVSDARGKPVFADFPIIMHRPIPEGGRIKCAAVHLRRIGPREEWSLTMTVQLADDIPWSPDKLGVGVVGVDVGWRQRADDGRNGSSATLKLRHGVRVAKWQGQDGGKGEIELPVDTKADELRSVRDNGFNSARDSLRAWLDTATVPEWLLAATRTMVQWRSIVRLVSLARRWEKNRFDGDEAAYATLEEWRYHDHHLWTWETSQRVQALRHRKEQYRLASVGLARRYAVCVLEDFDLRPVVIRPDADSDERINQTARFNRHAVAVSELRLAIESAFTARCGRVVLVPAAMTTKDCADCGTRNEWDQAKELRHACVGCGVVWDQDENAARNILERYRDVDTAAPARVKKTAKWAGRKRKGGVEEEHSVAAE